MRKNCGSSPLVMQVSLEPKLILTYWGGERHFMPPCHCPCLLVICTKASSKNCLSFLQPKSRKPYSYQLMDLNLHGKTNAPVSQSYSESQRASNLDRQKEREKDSRQLLFLLSQKCKCCKDKINRHMPKKLSKMVIYFF